MENEMIQELLEITITWTLANARPLIAAAILLFLINSAIELIENIEDWFRARRKPKRRR